METRPKKLRLSHETVRLLRLRSGDLQITLPPELSSELSPFDLIPVLLEIAHRIDHRQPVTLRIQADEQQPFHPRLLALLQGCLEAVPPLMHYTWYDLLPPAFLDAGSRKLVHLWGNDELVDAIFETGHTSLQSGNSIYQFHRRDVIVSLADHKRVVVDLMFHSDLAVVPVEIAQHGTGEEIALYLMMDLGVLSQLARGIFSLCGKEDQIALTSKRADRLLPGKLMSGTKFNVRLATISATTDPDWGFTKLFSLVGRAHLGEPRNDNEIVLHFK